MSGEESRSEVRRRRVYVSLLGDSLRERHQGMAAGDVTAGGVSGLGAWTRASTDLSYQLPVPTNHRRLLAFGSPLLECLDAPWPG